MEPTSSPHSSAAPHHGDSNSHWHKTRRVTGILLAVWFCSTFFFIFFARELDSIHIFGWPISFYMAAQGMLLIYIAIVVIYIRRMKHIEQQAHGEHAHGE